jgi:hypothetical protein
MRYNVKSESVDSLRNMRKQKIMEKKKKKLKKSHYRPEQALRVAGG